jgi:excinuclease ABC subunit B
MEDYGTRPFCLLDYFPKDFLLVVDESHVTFSSEPCMVIKPKRKFGRIWLPTSCSDGQSTVKFDEFEAMQNQVIYVSATPDYELQNRGCCRRTSHST